MALTVNSPLFTPGHILSIELAPCQDTNILERVKTASFPPRFVCTLTTDAEMFAADLKLRARKRVCATTHIFIIVMQYFTQLSPTHLRSIKNLIVSSSSVKVLVDS
jgi:hypothetical protein